MLNLSVVNRRNGNQNGPPENAPARFNSRTSTEDVRPTRPRFRFIAQASVLSRVNARVRAARKAETGSDSDRRYAHDGHTFGRRNPRNHPFEAGPCRTRRHGTQGGQCVGMEICWRTTGVVGPDQNQCGGRARRLKTYLPATKGIQSKQRPTAAQ